MESKLNIALKRIIGDTEDTVELCGINTDFPIKSATSILGDILVEDFVNTLPQDTETWYSVLDNGDEYDVQEIEPTPADIPTSLYQCLHAAFEALSTCQAVHWNARGEDFFTLHEKLDEYIAKLQGDIDELAELMKQVQCVVISPAMIYKDIQPVDVTNGFDIEQGFTVVKDSLSLYCVTLECLYTNFGHGIQSELDDILNYWLKEVDYKLSSLLN